MILWHVCQLSITAFHLQEIDENLFNQAIGNLLNAIAPLNEFGMDIAFKIQGSNSWPDTTKDIFETHCEQLRQSQAYGNKLLGDSGEGQQPMFRQEEGRHIQ